MNAIIPVYKPLAVTPLQVIKNMQMQYSQYKNETIGYAGRLDPMAEGLLLLLVGDENKQRKKYEAMEKEYTFTMLCGITTDTYDALGKITSINIPVEDTNIDKQLRRICREFIGFQIQEYPPYSSHPYKGKPLFYWARKGMIDEISLPTKKIEIYELSLVKSRISKQRIKELILGTIPRVSGDFRQEEILSGWNTFFTTLPQEDLIQVEGRIRCSSGTYVRGIVHRIGKELKIGAMTVHILRTQIGSYTLDNALQISRTQGNQIDYPV